LTVVDTKEGLKVGANVGSDDVIDGLAVIAIDGYNISELSDNFFSFIIITLLKKITFFKKPFHRLGFLNIADNDNWRLIFSS